MKVKMLSISAGPMGIRTVGSEHEVGEAEAKVLISGGYAVSVEYEKEEQRAQSPEESSPESAEKKLEEVKKAAKSKAKSR